MTLTAKQQRFVDEYLVDLNGKQAAIRAGYSAKTAEQGAAQLLRNIKVASAVSKAIASRSARTEVDQQMVVAGLMQEAKATGEDTTSSARIRAWELLGKHVGMFTEKHEHSGPNGGPIEKVTRIEMVAATSKGAGQ